MPKELTLVGLGAIPTCANVSRRASLVVISWFTRIVSGGTMLTPWQGVFAEARPRRSTHRRQSQSGTEYRTARACAASRSMLGHGGGGWRRSARNTALTNPLQSLPTEPAKAL